MIHKHLSIVIPFYNPPYEAFQACLQSIRKLDILEVILVDDCSSNEDVITLAKQSGFIYSPEQSESFLQLTMLNFRYGAQARNMLKKPIPIKVQA